MERTINNILAVTKEGNRISDIAVVEFFEDGIIIVNEEIPAVKLIGIMMEEAGVDEIRECPLCAGKGCRDCLWTGVHPMDVKKEIETLKYNDKKTDEILAALTEENRRLREALVPAMEWVRQNGVDGNIGMLDAFAAAEIIRGLATELIGSAHNFQEIYNVQNRPPSAAE